MKQLRWETKKRYYAARVYEDLLGGWVVERVWGGLQNNLGNGKQEIVPDYSAAVTALARLHAERRTRHYELVASR